MGDVYLARDVRLGRLVALKLISEELVGDAAARAHFETEARATARLAHPNIVTLYDVGELVDGRPWVTLEYVEGRTLSQMLRSGKPPLADAKRIALGIARAIAAAHAAGIVHRDLKPSNVQLAADGRPRVVDFGIARIAPVEEWGETSRDERGPAHRGPADRGAPLTPASGVTGTPSYMAPEQWTRSDAPASDVWSFGMLFIELLTGKHPLRGVPRGDLIASVTSDAPMPEPEGLRYVPEELARLAMRCLRKQANERPSADEIVAALVGAESVTPTPVDSEGSPFRGLAAFDEDGAALFHGREADLHAAIERLAGRPVLLVVGPSGSGKSSFVEAGLIPRLRAAEAWTVLRLRPGERPFEALADAIERVRPRDAEPTDLDVLLTKPMRALGERLRVDPSGPASLASDLRASPGLLAAILADLANDPPAAPGSKVLLWVDQLEEVVTLTRSSDEAAAFVQALVGAATDPSEPVRIVLATRDDYLGRIPWGELAATALAGAAQLQPLGPDGIREAILQPLSRRGYRFDDPSLVDEMIDAVANEGQSLPLLQFALSELWARRDATRNLLLRAAYIEMGQVQGALARHADGVVDAIAEARRPLARDLLLRLVTVERTRKACRAEELLGGLPPAAAEVLDRLVEARLVGRRGDTALFEVVHESLLGAWHRLARWIDESDDDFAYLRDLGQAAEQWERRGRRADELWRGDALAEASRVVARARAIAERTRSFVDAALVLQHKQRARRRFVAWAFAVTAIVATLASSLAAWQQLQRQRESTAARARADGDRAALLVESAFARNAEGDPAEARALVRAALEARDGAAARGLFALLQREPRLWFRPEPRVLYDVALSSDGRTAYAASQSGEIEAFDLVAHSRRSVGRHPDQVSALALTADGRQLASASWAGDLRITDLPAGTGHVVGLASGHIFQLAFTEDGRWLVVAQSTGRLSFVDLPTRTVVRTFDLPTGRLSALSVVPGGREVVAGGRNGAIYVVDVATASLTRSWQTGTTLDALANSADGRWLASSQADGHVRIYDWRNGALVMDRPVTASSVRALEFAPDGALLLGVRPYRVVELAPPTWEVRAAVAYPSEMTAFAVSHDGSTAVAVGVSGLLHYRRSVASLQPATPVGPALMVRWTEDGSTLMSSDSEGLLAWDLATARARRLVTGLPGVRGLGRLDGGLFLATHESGTAVVNLESGAVVEASPSMARPRTVVRLPALHALAISNSAGIELRDAATGEMRSVLAAHEGGARGLAVLADGQFLSAGIDGVVRRWTRDAASSRVIADLPPAATDVECAADGSMAYASSSSGRVVALDLRTDEVRVVADLGQRVYDLALSADGRWLAAVGADRRVAVIDLADDTQHFLVGHDGEVNTVAFSPDAAWLATGSDDETVRVWSTTTGALRWTSPSDRSPAGAESAARAAPLALETPRTRATVSASGSVVLHRRGGAGELELRDLPASPVRLLRAGPSGTIVVGTESGLAGIWDEDTGRALVTVRLHGPAIAATVAGGRVEFVSGLSDRREFDLSILERSYCDVMREVWSTQPLVWRDGAVSVQPPPASHPCR